jgi:hypothetical protein
VQLRDPASPKHQHIAVLLPAAGSAKAAQALFAATGQQIFTRGNCVTHCLLSCLFAVPLLGSAASGLYSLFRRKYYDGGIDEVLQRAFGGGDFGTGTMPGSSQNRWAVCFNCCLRLLSVCFMLQVSIFLVAVL